jgi:hypothetical protein
MRWAYIEARDIVSNSIVARARGDDRGEFLLILPSLAAQASELNSTLDVRVNLHIFAFNAKFSMFRGQRLLLAISSPIYLLAWFP